MLKDRCDYCGEPSKWGYYLFDGLRVCDECGDFVLKALSGSDERTEAMPTARCQHEGSQHVGRNPRLLCEMDRPLQDLLVVVTSRQSDIVSSRPGDQRDEIAVYTAKSSKLCLVIHRLLGRIAILGHHFLGMCGLEISSTNVKEHAPPLARAHVETGEKVHITGDVFDRAASGGCCGSSCSASLFFFSRTENQSTKNTTTFVINSHRYRCLQ